jgi:hypothetical protein
MISPDLALPQLLAVYSQRRRRAFAYEFFLAGADIGENLRIVQFVAEREMVHAAVDEPVVLGELLLGRGDGLQAHENAHALLERLDVGGRHVEAPALLPAGIEMAESDAVLGLGRRHSTTSSTFFQRSLEPVQSWCRICS